MAKTRISGECKLCGNNGSLCESHILPAFTFRWLKKRSGANGHIRNTDSPNQRIQDGVKEYWLCVDCEALFSRDETAFANTVFHPYDAGAAHIKYSEFMLRFCTSVSWRVLKFAFGRRTDARYSIEQRQLVEQAEARWRDFLLNRVPHPGQFEQHVIPWGTIESTTIPDLPRNINRFLTGPITLDIVGSSQSLMTFAKLGPFMIFGHIQCRKRSWEGSKISLNGGNLLPKKYVLPPSLIPLLKEKANLIEEGWSKLSDTQSRVIDENLIAKGEGFLDTPQGRAVFADAQMFGIGSVISKKS